MQHFSPAGWKTLNRPLSYVNTSVCRAGILPVIKVTDVSIVIYFTTNQQKQVCNYHRKTNANNFLTKITSRLTTDCCSCSPFNFLFRFLLPKEQQSWNLNRHGVRRHYLRCWVRVVVKSCDDNREIDAWFSNWVQINAEHRHLRTAAKYATAHYSQHWQV